MRVKMKFSSLLKVCPDPLTSKKYINIEDFNSFLTKSGDTVLRKSLNRSLRTFQGGAIKLIENQEYATLKSVLRYICTYDSLNGCQRLLKTIEQELTSESRIEQTTTLELYQLIAKTHIQKITVLFDVLQISENEIPTLAADYKHNFSELEWKKICWFENDFSRSVEFRDISYEETVDFKYKRFQSLLSLKECCESWKTSSIAHIRKNNLRIKLSEKHNEVRISAYQKHIASVLDSDIRSLLELFSKIDSVSCFDVTYSSERNCIWTVIIRNTNSVLESDFDDVCRRVFYSLKRRHNLYLEKAFLFDKDVLTDFISSDGIISRFVLRDAVETQKLVCYASSWNADDLIDGTVDIPEAQDCDRCFSENKLRPLNTESFDIVQEWFLELPIETQLLFEPFINVNTVRKHKEPEEIVEKKCERLYYVYDILLNIFNKKYIGLLQRSNANKLLIEYKSISSVFDVTAATGATPSLCYTEQKLKQEADSDLCYYNTYLKEHKLEYRTHSGEQNSCVSLRKCHLILLLDNLVRLQYIADPDPGIHRSKQLCTLPITVQGLPIDSDITEEWHLPDCDGTFNCICKQPVSLSDESVLQTLVQLNKSERDAHTSFFNWMTFGNHVIWKQLPDDLLEHIEESQQDVPAISSLDSDESSNNADNEQDDEDDTDCQDEDLVAVLGAIENVDTDEPADTYISDDEDEMAGLTILEKSMDEMSILEPDIPQEATESVQEQLKGFGFEKFNVPPLLTRHPPPGTGRDDNVENIKGIFDNVLTKIGYDANPAKCVNRILSGPDNKIGKCMFQLMNRDPKYNVFLPEFPLLHLRKSKINILLSAYKNSGILEILQVMRNDERNDWGSLISIQHIDMATKHIRRLALSFHLAFLISFIQHLEKNDMQEFLGDMEGGNCAETSSRWSKQFSNFLEYGSAQNATFALHVDMMRHCCDIIAISFAERLGGEAGYNLLLGAVKNSLLFSFVNGATSYAPYCVQLLYSHYSAGHFHQCLKRTLYTTPFKNSTKNFASDTKREMDHLDVVKGFRSGSNIESVTCRMALIDSLNETKHAGSKTEPPVKGYDDNFGMDISEVDLNHIYPAASLILRRGGISLNESTTSFNVYTKTPLKLPAAILDSASDGVGRYLLSRFLHKEKFTKTGVSTKTEVSGPKDLVSRVKRSKGVTIKRIQKSKVVALKTERHTKEAIRQKAVAKESKIIDALSSENNACQALLKPDSSKPKVAKSLCMPRALKTLVAECSPTDPMESYIALNLPYVPKTITKSTTICTVEFAGTKFKMGKISSGQEYIQAVERSINSLVRNSPIETMVICEEKYSFTPDEFKASTRDQRKTKSDSDVSHLKTSDNIISESTYDSAVITKTSKGKKLISNFLVENIEKLKIERQVDLVIDSELYGVKDCDCPGKCECKMKHSMPILCKFIENNSPEVSKLDSIKQSKGEAEMSVVDWLLELQNKLNSKDNAVCYVTSGDIDAVYIHLYAVSKKWKRETNGSFTNEMFVVLQKVGGKCDIFNITAMLTLLEKKYQDINIGMKVAFCLCLGGNDFIPKMYGISHDTIMKELIGNIHFRNNLFTSLNGYTKVNVTVFVEFVKHLYTPKRLRGKIIDFNELRAITINKKQDNSQKGGYKTTNPRKWLPPSSVIQRLCQLLQLQVEYLETVGNHSSVLPEFIKSGVLKKNSSGETEYDFGPDAHFDSIRDLPSVTSSKKPSKRTLENTPQHGARRKAPLLTSTPTSASSMDM